MLHQQFTVGVDGRPARADENALIVCSGDGGVLQRLPWRHLLQVRVLGPTSAELTFAGVLPIVLTFADHAHLAQFQSALESCRPRPDADADSLASPPHWI